MKMWNKKFLAAAVALSAMTGQVYAAETAHTGTEVDELMPTYSLGEVVVTATRTQKRDVDVPAATTVITAEDIKDSGASTASDVLSMANGFAYKAFGPNGAAMGTMSNDLNVRGFKGGTLVLMNGNPISWRGKYNLEAIPASSIERIEIVKGSGAVLYGSDAVSGVVNIITKKTTTNEAHVGFGNYGQRKYGVTIGDERFGFYYGYDQWKTREGASYSDENKTNRFRGETRTDIHDIEKRNAGFTYKINPRLNFLLNYYKSDVTYQRTVTDVRRSSIGVRVGDPFNKRKYEIKRYTSQLNYRDRDWKGSIYFNTGTTEAIGPVHIVTRDPSPRTPITDADYWYNTREKNRMFGMDLQRTWRLDRATATVGFKLEHETYHTLPAHNTKKGNSYNRNNWGLFGQWEQRFDGKNTGIFGLRETWTTGATKKQNYSNLSASAQWLHKLDRDSSLYVNISQSFVMPTFAQMYKDNSMQLPSPDLKPQKGINYEIGWKKMSGGHSWKAALFHMDVKDNITANLNGSRTSYQYTNEDFRNTGLEISDDVKGKNGFSYQWGLTWQNPQTKSNSTAKKALGWESTFGKIQLTGGVTYKKDKWASSLSASYLADRTQSPSNAPAYRSKPYLLTSWSTSYAPDENSAISLRIENVLDRHDVITHTGSDYYVAPINYLLSYNYRF